MSAAAPDRVIAGTIEEDVLFGRLTPGVRLTEEALLRRFSASRHFVRQALVHLEQLGIVRLERNRGATIRVLDGDEIRQIYEVRALLQRQAILLIPLPASESFIRELSDINTAFRAHVRSGSWGGVNEANDRFHSTLLSACSNPYLLQTIDLYKRHSAPVRMRSMVDRAALIEGYEQHALMIDMLRGTDNWVLAELCVDHLRASMRRHVAPGGRSGAPSRPMYPERVDRS